MRSDEAHPVEALHTGHVAEELGERLLRSQVATPRVDVLPEERHLAVSVGDELLDLRSDRLARTALLSAARGGHDAVGASLVAAVDDVDPRTHGRLALRLRHVLHYVRGCRRHNLVAVEDALKKVADPVGVLRPHHKVDLGHATQQGFALLLRDASGDDDGEVLAFLFARRVRSEVRVHLLLGVVADRARVQHDHLRFLRIRGLGEAHRL
mmetsp:Transcript_48391/g.104867  ORF Transcript_48391/g.104867 Transcript_48391/m.104867 type:complete len:210 (+) Transcript_48391:936-1565(+)